MRDVCLVGLCLLFLNSLLLVDVLAAPTTERDPRSSRDAISRTKDRKAKDKKVDKKQDSEETEQDESLFL
ncbi:MAG TPA: hypothetical protein PKO06_19710, partial [Candidatus Ozemobacteraceae bacterium]|nr:hypothetical protein [Candidatus Ozemobacteraceae bacterium]